MSDRRCYCPEEYEITAAGLDWDYEEERPRWRRALLALLAAVVLAGV